MAGPGDSGVEARNVAGALTSMRIDELISRLAIGIAQGQMELDRVCMQIAQFMGDAQIAFGKKPNSEEPDLLSLIELGFTPNFYQFVDTILEVRVSISTQFEERREYETSQLNLNRNETNQSSSNSGSSASSSSGYSYNRHGGGWWGSWNHGGSGSNWANSNSSAYSTSSSYKEKNLSMTTVDAKYASTYNYAVEAASSIKTKIVPVPPPEVLEEVIRAKVEQRREDERLYLLKKQTRDTASELRVIIKGLVDDSAGIGKTTAGSLKPEVAEKIGGDVNGIANTYTNKMTPDHWASIATEEIRVAADAALGEVTDNLELFKRKNSGDISVEGTHAQVRAKLADALNAFADRMGQIIELTKKPTAEPAADTSSDAGTDDSADAG